MLFRLVACCNTLCCITRYFQEHQKRVMGTDGGENSFILIDRVKNPNAVTMSRTGGLLSHAGHIDGLKLTVRNAGRNITVWIYTFT